MDHKKIKKKNKKREPKESINIGGWRKEGGAKLWRRGKKKERGSQIVEKRKKRKGEKGEFLRREKREPKT